MIKVDPPPKTTTLTTCPHMYKSRELNQMALSMLATDTKTPKVIAQSPAVTASTMRPRVFAGLKKTAEVAAKWPDMPTKGRKNGVKERRQANR